MLEEKGAWKILIWFGIFIAMAEALSNSGIITWFGQESYQKIKKLTDNKFIISSGVLLIFFFAHYFFASITSYITTMYAMFLTILLNLSFPPMLAAFILAFMVTLSAGLTHYGGSISPIMFSTNYMGITRWWKIGFIVSVTNIALWLIVGSFWWRLVGIL